LKALIAQRAALDADRTIAVPLGCRFAGSRTRVEPLKPACAWAQNAATTADAAAAVLRGGRPAEAANQIEHVLRTKAQTGMLLGSLSAAARIDISVFTEERDEIGAAAALEAAAQDAEGLFAHAALATALLELKETGTYPLVVHCMAGGVPAGLAEQFEALAVRKLARAVYAEHGIKLSRYPGSRLDQLRAMLARQDKKVIKLAQKQVGWKIHTDAKPPYGNGIGKKSTWTEMALEAVFTTTNGWV
jgi:hypothetical protein